MQQSVPREKGFPPRAQRLRELEATTFDVLVIGGGITGAAVARDAAARGLATALIERDDWASGTSWRSSKLIHGGLRYLESGDVRLVFESLSERARLTRLAPHLVRSTDFVFPSYRQRGLSRLELEMGLTLYDLLALGRSARWHRRLSREEILRRVSLLESPELLGGALYGDACTDDARLTWENVLDAAALGAVACSGLAVEALENDSGPVRAVRARDRESEQTLTARARVVVNATGPWGDGLRRLEDPGADQALRLSRGAHITVPASRLPVHDAIAFPVGERLLFAVPFGSATLVGTTDTDHDGSPDDVSAKPEDVSYILAAARQTFPRAALTQRDVLSTFCGLRPLVRQTGRSLTETSREEAILVSPSGLVTVTGGKLTTHRAMGQKTIDRVAPLLARQGIAVPESATRDRPFPGKPFYPMPQLFSRLRETAGSTHPALSDETLLHLGWRYGRRAEQVVVLAREDRNLGRLLCPGLPDIDAEVVFAARAEDAHTLSDVFIRRTHLFWQAPRQGQDALERAAGLMARELGWTADRRKAAIDEYMREVARSRGWSVSQKTVTI